MARPPAARPPATPPPMAGSPEGDGSLRQQLEGVIARLPSGSMTLGELLAVIGDEGLLVLSILLTLVFLIPVSIPGVSTVFGAAILLVGLSRLSGRPLWVPRRLADRALTDLKAEQGRQELLAGRTLRALVLLAEAYRGGSSSPTGEPTKSSPSDGRKDSARRSG